MCYLSAMQFPMLFLPLPPFLPSPPLLPAPSSRNEVKKMPPFSPFLTCQWGSYPERAKLQQGERHVEDKDREEINKLLYTQRSIPSGSAFRLGIGHRPKVALRFLSLPMISSSVFIANLPHCWNFFVDEKVEGLGVHFWCCMCVCISFRMLCLLFPIWELGGMNVSSCQKLDFFYSVWWRKRPAVGEVAMVGESRKKIAYLPFHPHLIKSL